MADVLLREMSPWAGLWRAGRFGAGTGETGLKVVESGPCATGLLAARRGRTSRLVKAAGDLGLELPRGPAWTQDRGTVVVWIAPEQWLLRAPGRFADLDAALDALTPYATLIDQSDARAVLTLSGPRARDVLAKGLEIDLHPRVFGPGKIAVAPVANISAVLWQVDDAPTYEIAVPRSFAGSFWHWLSEAAAEYGYRVDDERSGRA